MMELPESCDVPTESQPKVLLQRIDDEGVTNFSDMPLPVRPQGFFKSRPGKLVAKARRGPLRVTSLKGRSLKCAQSRVVKRRPYFQSRSSGPGGKRQKTLIVGGRLGRYTRKGSAVASEPTSKSSSDSNGTSTLVASSGKRKGSDILASLIQKVGSRVRSSSVLCDEDSSDSEAEEPVKEVIVIDSSSDEDEVDVYEIEKSEISKETDEKTNERVKITVSKTIDLSHDDDGVLMEENVTLKKVLDNAFDKLSERPSAKLSSVTADDGKSPVICPSPDMLSDPEDADLSGIDVTFHETENQSDVFDADHIKKTSTPVYENTHKARKRKSEARREVLKSILKHGYDTVEEPAVAAVSTDKTSAVEHKKDIPSPVRPVDNESKGKSVFSSSALDEFLTANCKELAREDRKCSLQEVNSLAGENDNEPHVDTVDGLKIYSFITHAALQKYTEIFSIAQPKDPKEKLTTEKEKGLSVKVNTGKLCKTLRNCQLKELGLPIVEIEPAKEVVKKKRGRRSTKKPRVFVKGAEDERQPRKGKIYGRRDGKFASKAVVAHHRRSEPARVEQSIGIKNPVVVVSHRMAQTAASAVCVTSPVQCHQPGCKFGCICHIFGVNCRGNQHKAVSHKPTSPDPAPTANTGYVNPLKDIYTKDKYIPYPPLPAIKQQPPCGEIHCRLGCVCESLCRKRDDPNRCGRYECMFERCGCPAISKPTRLHLWYNSTQCDVEAPVLEAPVSCISRMQQEPSTTEVSNTEVEYTPADLGPARRTSGRTRRVTNFANIAKLKPLWCYNPASYASVRGKRKPTCTASRTGTSNSSDSTPTTTKKAFTRRRKTPVALRNITSPGSTREVSDQPSSVTCCSRSPSPNPVPTSFVVQILILKQKNSDPKVCPKTWTIETVSNCDWSSAQTEILGALSKLADKNPYPLGTITKVKDFSVEVFRLSKEPLHIPDHMLHGGQEKVRVATLKVMITKRSAPGSSQTKKNETRKSKEYCGISGMSRLQVSNPSHSVGRMVPRDGFMSSDLRCTLQKPDGENFDYEAFFEEMILSRDTSGLHDDNSETTENSESGLTREDSSVKSSASKAKSALKDKLNGVSRDCLSLPTTAHPAPSKSPVSKIPSPVKLTTAEAFADFFGNALSQSDAETVTIRDEDTNTDEVFVDSGYTLASHPDMPPIVIEPDGSSDPCYLLVKSDDEDAQPKLIHLAGEQVIKSDLACGSDDSPRELQGKSLMELTPKERQSLLEWTNPEDDTSELDVTSNIDEGNCSASDRLRFEQGAHLTEHDYAIQLMEPRTDAINREPTKRRSSQNTSSSPRTQPDRVPANAQLEFLEVELEQSSREDIEIGDYKMAEASNDWTRNVLKVSRINSAVHNYRERCRRHDIKSRFQALGQAVFGTRQDRNSISKKHILRHALKEIARLNKELDTRLAQRQHCVNVNNELRKKMKRLSAPSPLSLQLCSPRAQITMDDLLDKFLVYSVELEKKAFSGGSVAYRSSVDLEGKLQSLQKQRKKKKRHRKQNTANTTPVPVQQVGGAVGLIDVGEDMRVVEYVSESGETYRIVISANQGSSDEESDDDSN